MELSGPHVVRVGAAGAAPSATLLEIGEISKAAASACRRGVLLDHGWVRLFGDGDDLPSLSAWNASGRLQLSDAGPSFYIANDVMGGLFLLNPAGDITYLSPDGLELEELTSSFEELLELLLSGDLETFYDGYRFPNWQQIVRELSPHESYFCYPPLWAEGGEEAFLEKREVVPALELRSFVLEALSE